MGKTSNWDSYLRFAALSFAAMVLAAGGLGFVAFHMLSSRFERVHADATTSAIEAPIGRALEGANLAAPLSPKVTAALDSTVGTAIDAEGIRAIRVLSPEHEPLYLAGDDSIPVSDKAPSGQGPAVERVTSPSGERSLLMSSLQDGYILEVVQDPSELDATIGGARVAFWAILTGFAFAGFVGLQTAFWFGIRRFSAAHERLRHLYNTGQEIRSSLDLHEVLTQLTRDGTDMANGEFGMVTLFEEETGDLLLKTTYDARSGTIAHHQRRIEEWFFRRCAATNTTLSSTQPAQAYRQIFGTELAIDGQLHLLCVPMAVRDHVVGVIAVVRTAGSPRGSYNAEETKLVEEVAGQAVMAVEQALLFAKMRNYADELEMSYDTTLKVLMAALDAKDDVTEGHCERVSKLTAHLAREMHVPEERLIDIERGALLHDVGKIGVPDAVLKKPKELNKLEWEAMQKHPLLAGLIVSKVGFLEGALPILLYHHERYDGQGYPFGLLRDKIPVEARIFSVVDSYDAMTSDRPYRAAMEHETAMAELRANSGTQFDPDVVEAFERLMAGNPELHEEQHGSRAISPLHHDHDIQPPTAEQNEDAA